MIKIAKYAVTHEEYVRIRPSVSWVEKEGDLIEFFIGNTRGKKSMLALPSLKETLRYMDGTKTLKEISELVLSEQNKVIQWVEALVQLSIVERLVVSNWIENSPFRRSLNMLGDFFPDYEVQAIWERIGKTNFIILGCGAVGSWIADGIARMGARSITLVDPDIVEVSNLNRSLFKHADIGSKKTTALALRLCAINQNIVVNEFNQKITCKEDLAGMVNRDVAQVIISCIDSPNVDVAAGIVNNFCVDENISFVVAGGYNLHLSLIGITVIPKKSACFNCSLIYLTSLQNNNKLPIKKLDRPHRNIGNIAPLSALTASIAAMEAIRIAANDERFLPVMLNKRGEFNLFTEQFEWLEIPIQSSCPVCSL